MIKKGGNAFKPVFRARVKKEKRKGNEEKFDLFLTCFVVWFVSVRFMYMLLCVHFLSLSSCLSILVFPRVFVFERDTLDRSCPTVKGLEEILLGMFLKKIKADFSLCLSLNSGEMF